MLTADTGATTSFAFPKRRRPSLQASELQARGRKGALLGWLSLLVWLYFMEGVVRATTEAGLSQALAVAEIALTLLLFAACAMYIRWRLRSAARQPDAA